MKYDQTRGGGAKKLERNSRGEIPVKPVAEGEADE
jgi:hypothetical protein